MKLLSISTDRDIFKEGSSVRERMKELGAMVDELHIIVYTTRFRHPLKKSKYQLSPTVQVYPTRSLSRWLYVFDALRIGRSILKAKKDGFTLMSQDPFETGLSAVIISRWYKLSLLVQLHTDVFSPYYAKLSLLNRVRVRLARKILAMADTVRTVSARSAESVRSVLKTAAPRIVTLPIFVDVNRIVDEFPNRNDLSQRYTRFNFIILMASRLEAEKDIETGLRAFKEVVDVYPSTGLVIAGEGSRRKGLLKTARKLGLSNNVVFEARTDKLISYLKTSQAFLNTSLYEGYGMTLIEAAASGSAIVSTDVGLVGEILEPGEEVLVSPVGDSQSISRHLLRLVEKDNHRRMLQRNARRAAEEVAMSKQEHLKRFQQMLESVGR